MRFYKGAEGHVSLGTSERFIVKCFKLLHVKHNYDGRASCSGGMYPSTFTRVLQFNMDVLDYSGVHQLEFEMLTNVKGPSL